MLTSLLVSAQLCCQALVSVCTLFLEDILGGNLKHGYLPIRQLWEMQKA